MKRQIIIHSTSSTTVDSVKEILAIAKLAFTEVEAHSYVKKYPTSSMTKYVPHTISTDKLDIVFRNSTQSDSETLFQLSEVERIVHETKLESYSYEPTMFDIVSKLSGGTAKQVTREDKIEERHRHDVKHGSTATLDEYREATSHDNLLSQFIDLEGGLTTEELNYNCWTTPQWTMVTQGSARYYNTKSSI